MKLMNSLYFEYGSFENIELINEPIMLVFTDLICSFDLIVFLLQFSVLILL